MYWHGRFDAMRRNGEWFELTARGECVSPQEIHVASKPGGCSSLREFER